MMKLILLVLALLVVYWIFWGRRQPPRAAAPPAAPAPETMVACADCGLRLPRSEAIAEQDRHYCCDEHRERHTA